MDKNERIRKVVKWLETFERDCVLEDDIEVMFTTGNVSHGLPFTGLLKLTGKNESKCMHGESSLKILIESEYGPINRIPDKLERLADHIENGIQIFRDSNVLDE